MQASGLRHSWVVQEQAFGLVLPAMAAFCHQHAGLVSHAPSMQLLLDCYAAAPAGLRPAVLEGLVLCLRSSPQGRSFYFGFLGVGVRG